MRSTSMMACANAPGASWGRLCHGSGKRAHVPKVLRAAGRGHNVSGSLSEPARSPRCQGQSGKARTIGVSGWEWRVMVPGLTDQAPSNTPSNKQASAGWRWLAESGSSQRDLRRWTLAVAELGRLISVRSVVQLYPGP